MHYLSGLPSEAKQRFGRPIGSLGTSKDKRQEGIWCNQGKSRINNEMCTQCLPCRISLSLIIILLLQRLDHSLTWCSSILLTACRQLVRQHEGITSGGDRESVRALQRNIIGPERVPINEQVFVWQRAWSSVRAWSQWSVKEWSHDGSVALLDH